MATAAVTCNVPPDRVWSLIARPDRWHEWSPYVKGARGLGTPEVEQGAHGSVLVRGGVRVAATITSVVPGEAWTWRVMGLRLDHTVRAEGAAASRIELRAEGAAGAPWSLAALAYTPALALIVRNIARVAERGY
jgi:uncharacterized protein YndB with AHSA1/START domain